MGPLRRPVCMVLSHLEHASNGQLDIAPLLSSHLRCEAQSLDVACKPHSRAQDGFFWHCRDTVRIEFRGRMLVAAAFLRSFSAADRYEVVAVQIRYDRREERIEQHEAFRVAREDTNGRFGELDAANDAVLHRDAARGLETAHRVEERAREVRRQEAGAVRREFRKHGVEVVCKPPAAHSGCTGKRQT